MNQLVVKAHGLGCRLAIHRHSQEILLLVWTLDSLGKQQGGLWSRNIRSSGLHAFLRLATHCRKRYKSANSSQKNEAKQKPHLMHKDIRVALWDVRQTTRFLVTRSDCNTSNNLRPICPRSIQGFWIKIDQLAATCFIISLFTAQHVSNVSTSIFRSLQLIVDLFHGLYCSGSMCVGVTVWFGWGGVVSLCRQCNAMQCNTTHEINPQ